MNSKFLGPLIVVEDLSVSKKFYEELLEQRVKIDFGEAVHFQGGLAIQSKTSMARLLGLKTDEIMRKSNNAVMYFEIEQFAAFVLKLKEFSDIRYIHDMVELPWGPQSVCFYDPDEHAVHVSESMRSVCRRFFKEGLSLEQIAKRTRHPTDFVKSCLD